jgi:anti-sigma regulatory factor (Ser/Thr protein kinase)
VTTAPPDAEHLVVHADAAAIGRVRGAMAAFALAAGASADTVAAVRLAVSEAVTNSVRHAYDEGTVDGEIRTDAHVDVDAGGWVMIVSVADDGPGMRARHDSPGLGLGLPLIAQMAQSFDVINTAPGATLCMRFTLP